LKQGVLLMNLGGPSGPEEVKGFLYRLFSDPDILVGIPSPFRQALAFAIAQVKGPSSIRAYEEIGGGSPQLRWTRLQAEALDRALGGTRRVAIGMRASRPSIADGLRQLRDWGVEEVTLLPLFPQYSTTTTGSCLKEARRVLEELDWNPAVREVRHWPDHPRYVSLWRRKLEETLRAAGDAEPVHVLFSAHSLPLKIVERGDPYPDDVRRTIEALTAGLTRSWSLAYQSRNGRMPWLEPYVEDELDRLGRNRVRRIVVVPVSFVSDHIETLWELDRFYAERARRNGIEGYYRVPSFNDDPEFGEVLKELV
jgi:ferrochelatase